MSQKAEGHILLSSRDLLKLSELLGVWVIFKLKPVLKLKVTANSSLNSVGLLPVFPVFHVSQHLVSMRFQRFLMLLSAFACASSCASSIAIFLGVKISTMYL